MGVAGDGLDVERARAGSQLACPEGIGGGDVVGAMLALQVAGGRTQGDAHVAAFRQGDGDITGDCIDLHGAGERLAQAGLDVAADRLRLEPRGREIVGKGVAGDGFDGDVAAGVVEQGVAADRFDGDVQWGEPADALYLDIAGDGFAFDAPALDVAGLYVAAGGVGGEAAPDVGRLDVAALGGDGGRAADALQVEVARRRLCARVAAQVLQAQVAAGGGRLRAPV